MTPTSLAYGITIIITDKEILFGACIYVYLGSDNDINCQ